MMAYRMTPARRAALRKAQAASARKRRGKGGRKRRIKRAAKVGGAVAAVGVVGYAAYRTSSRRKSRSASTKKKYTGRPTGKIITLYHRTHAENVSSIEKNGLRGSNYGVGRRGHGKAHLSSSRSHTRPFDYRYGQSFIEVKISRTHLRPDLNEPGAPYYAVDPKHIISVKKYKKRARVSDNPMRRVPKGKRRRRRRSTK